MVVSVRWCPGDEHKLVSCSYDGTVKLWDTRGKLPLHTVKAHEGERAMGCDFHGPRRIVSGGTAAACDCSSSRIPSRRPRRTASDARADTRTDAPSIAT